MVYLVICLCHLMFRSFPLCGLHHVCILAVAAWCLQQPRPPPPGVHHVHWRCHRRCRLPLGAGRAQRVASPTTVIFCLGTAVGETFSFLMCFYSVAFTSS